MPSSQLSVSWKDHSVALSTLFKTALENNFLVDCTIAADGQRLKAHRLILSACSPYLQMLFGEETEKHPVVFLKDVSFETLKTMVNFIYRGETDISEENLDDFLALAASLQINSISINAAKDIFYCSSNDSKVVYELQSSITNQGGSNDCFTVQHDNCLLDVLPEVPTTNADSFEECVETLNEEVKPLLNQSPHVEPPSFADESAFDLEQSVLEPESVHDLVLVPKQEPIDIDEIDEVFQNRLREGSNTVVAETAPTFSEQGCSGTYEMEVKSSEIEASNQRTPALDDESSEVDRSAEPESGNALLLPEQRDISLVKCHEFAQDTLEDNSNALSEESASYFEEGNFSQFSGEGTAEAARRPAVRGRRRLQQGERRVHACPHCRKMFPKSSCLQRHLRVHTGERPFQCTDCGKAFSLKTNLAKHMRKHTGERPFKCVVCENAFSRKGILETHMRKHTGERPYKCVVCGDEFSQKGSLTVHMRRHTGDRPFKCSFCGDAFSNKSNLNDHMSRHTGDRPFKCDVCSDSFARKTTLNVHMRRHTGKRPYKCDICGDAFSQKGSLNVHMRRHTGERPFICNECGATFVNKVSLRRHTNSRHCK